MKIKFWYKTTMEGQVTVVTSKKDRAGFAKEAFLKLSGREQQNIVTTYCQQSCEKMGSKLVDCAAIFTIPFTLQFELDTGNGTISSLIRPQDIKMSLEKFVKLKSSVQRKIVVKYLAWKHPQVRKMGWSGLDVSYKVHKSL